jgi:DNA-binding NarL/FixJ family response regulator
MPHRKMTVMPPEDRSTRVLVADRSEEVCHALARLLSAEADIQVVASAGTEQELIEAAATASPDVLLLDDQLPRLGVARLLEQLRATLPDLAVLVLAIHPGELIAAESGPRTVWMLKDSSAGELRTEVRSLMSVVR